MLESYKETILDSLDEMYDGVSMFLYLYEDGRVVPNVMYECHGELYDPDGNVEDGLVGIFNYYPCKHHPEYFKWLVHDSIFSFMFDKTDEEFNQEYGTVLWTKGSDYLLFMWAASLCRLFHEYDYAYKDFLFFIKDGYSPESALMKILDHRSWHTPITHPNFITDNMLKNWLTGKHKLSGIEYTNRAPYFRCKDIVELFDFEGVVGGMSFLNYTNKVSSTNRDHIFNDPKYKNYRDFKDE